MGALSGAAGEYLKQSEEGRKNKYQEIRDRRLADLTTKENIRAEGVKSEEAATERDWRANESELGREHTTKEREAGALTAAEEAKKAHERKMQESVMTTPGAERGRLVQQPDGSFKYEVDTAVEKTFAPNLANEKWRASLVGIRGPGGKEVNQQTREQLYKEWEGQAYLETTDPILGKVVTRDPSIPSWDEWYNARVTDQYRVSPSDLKTQRNNPMELYLYFQNKPEFQHPGGLEGAIDIIQQIHPWWDPDDVPSLKGKWKKTSEKAKDAADKTAVPTEPGTIPGTPLQKGQSGAWSPAASAGGAPTQKEVPYDQNAAIEKSPFGKTPEQIAAEKARYGRT
jgi:hypothetical protein